MGPVLYFNSQSKCFLIKISILVIIRQILVTLADVKLAKTENNLSLAADAAWMSAKLSINVNIRKLKNNYFNKMLNLAGAG